MMIEDLKPRTSRVISSSFQDELNRTERLENLHSLIYGFLIIFTLNSGLWLLSSLFSWTIYIPLATTIITILFLLNEEKGIKKKITLNKEETN